MMHPPRLLAVLAIVAGAAGLFPCRSALNAQTATSGKGTKAALLDDCLAEQDRPLKAVARIGTSRFAHGALVYAIAFSPDSTMVATAGSSPRIHLWDVQTAKELGCLTIGGEDRVQAIVFSPNGKLLACSNALSRIVRVWSLPDRRLIYRLEAQKQSSCLAISPDGRVLASVGTGSTCLFWNLQTGKMLPSIDVPVPLRTPLSRVGTMEFWPDGKRFLVACERTICVFSFPDRRELTRLQMQDEVSSLALSPDGGSCAITTSRGSVSVIATSTGEAKWTKEYSGQVIKKVSYSPDGRRLICSAFVPTRHHDNSCEGGVALINAVDGAKIADLGNPQGSIDTVAWSPDGRWLAAGGLDGCARLWDAQSLAESDSPNAHRGPVQCICFTPDSRSLVTGGWDRTVRLWHVESGKFLRLVGTHDGAVSSVCVAPSGKTAASGSVDETACIWDLDSVARIRRFDVWSSSVALLAKGRLLVASDPDGRVNLWEIATGKSILRYAEDFGVASDFTVSPDGRYLLAIRGISGLFEAGTGKLIHQMLPENIPYESVVFSRDSSMIAAAAGLFGRCKDAAGDITYAPGVVSFLRVYDVNTGKEKHRFEGHEGTVSSVAFSGDDNILLSGGNDRTLRLWEVKTGRQSRCLRLARPVTSLVVSPDGRLVAAGFHDGTVLIWELAKLLGP
jgi:WD40 repeat protein